MKILVVDDNQFILEVIQHMLGEEGHDFVTHNNVDDAIAFLEKDRCGLVITDIVMPEKDGTKLAQYVKSKTPELPVLAITGGVENAIEDYAHYAEMFADKVLTKPLKKDELIDTIKALAA